jgi:hypothetical protein
MSPGRLVILLFAIVGCGGNLRVQMIDAQARHPSNVAVYFTVDKDNGDPVPGLSAQQFQIFEDGAPVSALESKQTILNPEVAATHYTLLLVDMSGSVTESGDVPVIVQSAQAFADRVQKYQRVAAYAFDGSPEAHEIAGFSTAGSAAAGIARLGTFKARDPSTNLNGAIVEALKILHRQMAASPTPLTFGTLVVFTDGTDRAGRVTHDQLHKELETNDLDIVVIGVGAEVDAGELRSIGRSGAILNKDRAQIASSFEAAAARIEGFSKRYYLLGYCSPARAGEHVVRIETNAAGQGGSLEYKFDAKGFGPDCDPNQPPSFNLKRPTPRKPDAGSNRR